MLTLPRHNICACVCALAGLLFHAWQADNILVSNTGEVVLADFGVAAARTRAVSMVNLAGSMPGLLATTFVGACCPCEACMCMFVDRSCRLTVCHPPVTFVLPCNWGNGGTLPSCFRHAVLDGARGDAAGRRLPHRS